MSNIVYIPCRESTSPDADHGSSPCFRQTRSAYPLESANSTRPTQAIRSAYLLESANSASPTQTTKPLNCISTAH